MSIISRTVKSLNTLAVDTNVFSGANKINRKIGGNSTVEFGEFTAQRILSLTPGRSNTLDLLVYGLIVLTDKPITLTMGQLTPVSVNKLFVYYGEVSTLKFENLGVDTANISFAYVADPVPASALSLTFMHLGAGMAAGFPLTYTGDSVVYPPLPAPVVDFSVSATFGAIPLGIAFMDASMNNPTSWLWNFGDGNTSTFQNPSHMYTVAGAYDVTLTATNAAGTSSLTKTSAVTATPTTVFVPVANFTNSAATGSIPHAVTFTDTSTNAPTAWLWNFGDGNTSTAQNPTHTYTVAGNYTVSLQASNVAGANTRTRTTLIHAVIPVPVADFTSNVTSGLTPLAVNFSDASTLAPTSWLWDFGDGVTSVARNPSHTYIVAGTYTVSLTATNSSGSNTMTKSALLNIAAPLPAPVANFTSDTVTGGIPLAVQFTDTTTNVPTTWLWDFGDGATSTAQNPSHNYTTRGNYTVALTATSSTGTDTITRTAFITALAVTPVANFTSNVASGAVPLSVNFTDTSSNIPTSWLWNFGDGVTSTLRNPSHNYATSGTYTVALTATNSAGNHTVTKTSFITVNAVVPVADFISNTASGVAPLAVNFIDTSTNVPTSWAWDFGDGATATTQNPSHTYTVIGNYTVALVATNAAGNDTATKTAYISATAPPAVTPVANFTSNVASGTIPLSVNFTDTSSNTPTAWLWNFGDSTTSTAQNPSHNYTTAGLFNVSLRATNAAGNHTVTKASFITASVPVPVASFTANVVLGAAPLSVQFTDTSSNIPTSWSWDFGDGVTSTLQNPSHVYSAAGTYTVILTSTNVGGSNARTQVGYITASSSATFWSTLNYSPTPADEAFFDGVAYYADQSVVAVGSAKNGNALVNTVKWSPSGTKMWESAIGDAGEVSYRAGEYAVPDAAGNVYVVSGNDVLSQTIGLYKLDSSGTVLWQKDLAAGFGAWPEASVMTTDGLVTLYYFEEVASVNHMGLIKLNASGGITWQVEFDLSVGAGGPIAGLNLTQDSSGNLYVLMPPPVTAPDTGTLLKFSSTGTLLWSLERPIDGLTEASYGSLACNGSSVYFVHSNVITEVNSSGTPTRVFTLNGMNASPATFVASGNMLYFVCVSTPVDTDNLVVGAINLTTGALSYTYYIEQGLLSASIWYNNTYSRALAVSSDRLAVVGYCGVDTGAFLVNMPLAMLAHPTGMQTLSNGIKIMPYADLTLSLTSSSPAAMTSVGVDILTTVTVLTTSSLPTSLITTTFTTGLLTDI